ncbi:putative protein kinase [Plasmopara halstedii]
MQATDIFSDESCNSPITLTVAPAAFCLETDCTLTTIAGKTYYSETNCPSSVYEHADDFYDEKAYLLIDFYRETSCTTYVQSVAFAATGSCQIGNDEQSVIATLSPNGSAHMTYYLDNSCNRPAAIEYTVTEDDILSHSCVSGRRFYSSADGVATNGVREFLPPSTTNDNGSNVSGGVIAVIIVGILFLLIFAGILLYRRCHRRAGHQSPLSPVFNQSDDPRRHDAYQAQSSPSKAYFQSTSTTISEFDRRHSARLWDDDIIVAARIPRENLKVGQLLTRGGYGEVYIGSYLGKDVAVKMLLPETKKTMSHVNAFLSEVKLMASLHHPHIVSFVGVAWDQLIDLCVVTEYMVGGDLKALLNNYEKNGHAVGFDRTKVKIAIHVASALVYLHSCKQPVIHRDLKSKNILLDKDMNAKVTDFGISRERVDATMTGGIGTSLWMAPEVMMGERYDDKADMFSFGVVLSELDSHTTPYALSKNSSNTTSSSSSAEPNKLPNAAIMQMVAAGKLRVHFSDAGPKSIVDLGYACVAVDPAERPTASEALKKLRQILAKEV